MSGVAFMMGSNELFAWCLTTIGGVGLVKHTGHGGIYIIWSDYFRCVWKFQCDQPAEEKWARGCRWW